MQQGGYYLNLNLLPPEYRRPWLWPRGWLFLIIALVAALSLYPLFQMRAQSRQEIAQMETRLNALKAERGQLKEQVVRVEELNAALQKARADLEGAKGDYLFLLTQTVRLHPILETAVNSLPAGVSLSSLSTDGLTLEVAGSAATPSQVTSYLVALKGTGLFTAPLLSYEQVSEALDFTISLEVGK